jgi:Rrf2 family nitric oxide-sensitive transcriptional repressor
MQLTKHTDYAFRILIFLATLEREKLTTIKKLSESFDISKSHAMKIVNKLVHQNWVKATRGKNGGVQLGMKASEISLKDVILLMEQTLEPVNCDMPLCAIKTACQLKGILVQAQEQYLAHLEKFTIGDLVNNKTIDVIRLIS